MTGTIGVFAGLILATSIAGAQPRDAITLASGTSPEVAGLYDHLLPAFENKTGIQVRVVAVGTGQALEIARRGDADVVIVHHRPSERRFIDGGYGVSRRTFMKNDFVLVGPTADPAGIRGMEDAALALKRIASSATPFVSRGDRSGTHLQEMELWKAIGREPSQLNSSWYRELGAGMGRTLNTAAVMGAYTLSDRGTWLAFEYREGLRVLVEGDSRLGNPYSVIQVNPERHPHVNAKAVRRFVQWLTGDAGQQAIAGYQLRGDRPFHPIAADLTRAPGAGSSK